MERSSSPLRTPNTYRDSNEVSSKRELAQPAAAAAAGYDIEPMDFDPSSAPQSFNAGDSSTLRHDDSWPNRVTNRPLPKSVVRPERTDQRQSNPIPRAAPERILYNNDPVLEASGFDTSHHAALSADEAYALQLQQEEYSRDSLATPRHPFFPFRFEPGDDNDDDDDDDVIPSAPLHVIDTPHPQFTGDAEFAAFLQQQENRSRGRSNRHPGLTFPARHLSHPQPSDAFQVDEHGFQPMPHMFVPYVRRNDAHNADDSDEEHDPRINIPHPLLRLLARSNHFGGFPGRGFRRSGNLQDTEDDFGPDDYERLLRLDDTVRKKKLTNDQINSIPIETFTRTSNNSDEENKCAVCLDLFVANQVLRRFPCRHIYHKECADRWLQENNVCPICREMPVKVASTGHSRSTRGTYHSRRPTHTHQAPASRPTQHRRGRSSQRPS